MQNQAPEPAHPSGQTSGSNQRPPHELSEAVTVLDLLGEAATLRREAAWVQGDRNAKTYVKEADLRVVLTVLKDGATLREHQVPGTAVVQVLTGRLRLRLSGREVELPAGQLVIIEPNLPHDVEALEESAFVITIAWSGGPRGDAR
jgi:quercetin dioxygenase-like cupin family protein